MNKGSTSKAVKNLVELISDKTRLTVEIIEKKPLFIFNLKSDNKDTFYELDESLSIISVDRIHDESLPFLIEKKNTIKDGSISGKVKSLYPMLLRLKKNDYKFFSEISEIYFRDDKKLSIRLKNRNTEFVLKPKQQNFIRLKYLT